MSKYTPGPWFVAAHVSTKGERLILSRSQREAVAFVPVDHAHAERSHANALLLAAAPQMAEALRKFVARAEQMNGVDTGPLAEARAALTEAGLTGPRDDKDAEAHGAETRG